MDSRSSSFLLRQNQNKEVDLSDFKSILESFKQNGVTPPGIFELHPVFCLKDHPVCFYIFEANNKARVMKGGRKNLKRAAGEEAMTLQEGQSIMQVVSLRGSNVIEVLDAKGEKSLAFFPAKFQKSMWIKRGSFVVVDESGRDEALESGSKVACIVLQVLFFEQVRVLQRSPEWPQIFKTVAITDDASSGGHPLASTFQTEEEEELNSSDDEDGLLPLEANLNRVRPVEFRADRESGSDSDSDSDS